MIMKNIGLLLPYDYKLLSIAAILDVFETVNKIFAENKLDAPFKIQVLQTYMQIKQSENLFHGYSIQTLDSDTQYDIVLIPSFTTNDMKETLEKNRDFIPWLQQQYKAGSEIASFCTGAFLFGATGLLNGRSATTHVDACSSFSSFFPLIHVKAGQTVTIDERCYMSGGSTSTFHLLVLLIQKYCGSETAIRIAKIFAIDMNRHVQSYFSTFRPNYTHHDDLVKQIQKKIERNFSDINTIEEIIKDLPSSRRNLVRRFKQVTGVPPIEYLQHVRIETAKKQLEQTNQSISEVLSSTGYTDPKSFRRTFHKIVGMKPQEYREKFRVM
jgi:transcriptional regulator GlxA family with amidase domain